MVDSTVARLVVLRGVLKVDSWVAQKVVQWVEWKEEQRADRSAVVMVVSKVDRMVNCWAGWKVGAMANCLVGCLVAWTAVWMEWKRVVLSVWTMVIVLAEQKAW